MFFKIFFFFDLKLMFKIFINLVKCICNLYGGRREGGGGGVYELCLKLFIVKYNL